MFEKTFSEAVLHNIGSKVPSKCQVALYSSASASLLKTIVVQHTSYVPHRFLTEHVTTPCRTCCCWDAMPRPPPFTVLANAATSHDDVELLSIASSTVGWPWSSLRDEPLMDAANDLASDSWSSTGLNRSSKN